MRATAEGRESHRHLARNRRPAVLVTPVRLGARCAAVLALVLCWAGRIVAIEPQPDTAWVDHDALADGQVQVSTRTDHLTVRIKVAIAVAAPPQDIWAALTACALAPEYVPNVQSCRSIEKLDGGRAELFVQTVKPAFFLPTFEHVFRLDYEPYTRIGVHRVSGPLESMDGDWWLLPQADGTTLVLYELAVDPGIPVPRFFVRATMKRDIPKILTAVRDRAEGR